MRRGEPHAECATRPPNTTGQNFFLILKIDDSHVTFAVCVNSSHAGVEIIEGLAELNLAALSNVLRVVDGPPQDAADLIPVWLKVVGIEDLLAEQISSWMARRSPTGDISARIHALDALSRAGVGGRLRTGYLQRCMAWEIHGEVVLGSWLSEEGREPDPVARTTSPTGAKAGLDADGQGGSNPSATGKYAEKPDGIPAIRPHRLKVSAIGFGCWEIGGTYGPIDEAHFERAVTARSTPASTVSIPPRPMAWAFQRGTRPRAGSPPERCLSRHKFGVGYPEAPNRRDSSRTRIMASIEQSLRISDRSRRCLSGPLARPEHAV